LAWANQSSGKDLGGILAAQIEVCLGIIAACLPVFSGVFMGLVSRNMERFATTANPASGIELMGSKVSMPPRSHSDNEYFENISMEFSGKTKQDVEP
jgi:hypothetical protein